jgi:hypothetical protein
LSSCGEELSLEEDEETPCIDALMIVLLKQRSNIAPLNVDDFRNIPAMCDKIAKKANHRKLKSQKSQTLNSILNTWKKHWA